MCTNVHPGKKTGLGLVYTWRTEDTDGNTWSIDKLVMDFRLNYREGQGLFDALSGVLWLEFIHWESRKMGSFRDQFTFELDGGRSFWLGVGLNSPTGLDARKCRLEFNPNKVGASRALRWVFNLLYDRSKGPTVKRWDLAVDLPQPREDLELVKDGRLYEEHRKSASDRTQYLGERNAPGRVKLYNKTREAALTEDVTRMEITLAGDDCDVTRARELWPRVLKLPRQLQILGALNETDRFIVKTLLGAPDRVGELSRRKREKLEPLLQQGGTVVFDTAAYRRVLQELRRWTERQMKTPPPEWSGGQYTVIGE